MAEMAVRLSAVILTLLDNSPAILRLPGPDDLVADILPSGPFDPEKHTNLEAGLRHWVVDKTGLSLGHCDQLFATGNRILDIGYLAISKDHPDEIRGKGFSKANWKNWYAFLPWEDWRQGRPAILDEIIMPALNNWANNEGAYTTSLEGTNSSTLISQAFGTSQDDWIPSRVIERFDLMVEAGLLEESVRSGQVSKRTTNELLGSAMPTNNRRMIAAAMAKMREKLNVQPTMFELMDNEFSLTRLQQTVESVSGQLLHKQNYRRVIEQAKIVEQTGESVRETGGRPAALYRKR